MAGLVFDPAGPAYDPLQLMVLADQAGETAAQRFLDEYLGLLPERQERILRGLAVGDLVAAMDAVLSLKVTSSMVGAVRLSLYCGHLQDLLEIESVGAADVAADMVALSQAFVQAVNGK
jgi:HPt (histidine-containing phosphotransfer) domain-containing protein